MVKEKLTEGTEVSSNSMKALNSNPANTIAVNDIKTVAQFITNQPKSTTQPQDL